MYYISKIQLKNTRCFEDIELELGPYQSLPRWNVILGNNGVGKTTLLRAIAIGLCDATSAASLLGDLYGPWIRRQGKQNSAVVRIDFAPLSKGAESIFIETTIQQSKSGYLKVDQKTNAKDKSALWDNIFVCGYGAARRSYGTRHYDEYSVPDAVYSLFNYDIPLQNPELMIRRLSSVGVNIEKLLNSICTILDLPPGSISLDFAGLTVSGPWGKAMPMGALGDGYQSVLAWIIDFLGWAMLYGENIFDKKNLGGIILIDEIEQHLHPHWQSSILRLLKEQFPRIQLIVATHSPLAVAGLSEFSQEEINITLLHQPKKRKPVEWHTITSVDSISVNQIFSTEAFGLPAIKYIKYSKAMERLSYLYLKGSKSNTEEEEFNKLSKKLRKEIPEMTESIEDRNIIKKIDKSLSLIEKNLSR